MRSRLRVWKYPISIILLLLLVAVFTLVYAFSESAKAPHERPEDSELVNYEQEPEPEPEPEQTPEPTPEQTPEPDPDDIFNPGKEGFITFSVDEDEIYKGYLLLVNHDHSFTISNDMDLVNIAEAGSSIRVAHNSFRLLSSIIEPLDEMMTAFISSAGYRAVTIISAFRTMETQQRILNNNIANMGRREALRWTALPGHSEHHTGLAFDFGVISEGRRVTFTGTGSTAWFKRNSHIYGFILRYPQNKTHITQTNHEPWHFRYVGLPHSTIIMQNDWCLEEYIDLLRNHSIDDPLTFELENVLYEIYFSETQEVKVPLNSDFEISGNNVDGIIVTAVRQEANPNANPEDEV